MAQKLIGYMITQIGKAIQAYVPDGTIGEDGINSSRMCVKKGNEMEPIRYILGWVFCFGSVFSPNYSNPLYLPSIILPLKNLVSRSMSIRMSQALLKTIYFVPCILGLEQVLNTLEIPLALIQFKPLN